LNLPDWLSPILIVNIAIGFTIIELAALLVHHRLTGRGLTPPDYALNMLSGLFLMLAVSSVLHSWWVGMALCLTASGMVHTSDMVWRLRRKRGT
jgi:hypothetical protein